MRQGLDMCAVPGSIGGYLRTRSRSAPITQRDPIECGVSTGSPSMSASADVTFKAAKNADHPLLCDCDYVL